MRKRNRKRQTDRQSWSKRPSKSPPAAPLTKPEVASADLNKSEVDFLLRHPPPRTHPGPVTKGQDGVGMNPLFLCGRGRSSCCGRDRSSRFSTCVPMTRGPSESGAKEPPGGAELVWLREHLGVVTGHHRGGVNIGLRRESKEGFRKYVE